ncbi:S8 family serine peptidase [Oceanicaulis sp. MMSF_3324]|uniref:S8 family peptidase n=1 Tax=Oceanicaulis sp. MMSF_3324 TaxID=3046702 RepID=UPI00273D3CEB|nr:S8 family serine peptidase [Oceanicaulis sp. MMSF_3324]
MSKTQTLLAVLLGAGSILVSSGALHAQQGGLEPSQIALTGPVSDRALAQLGRGERTSVIVILDVSVDEMIAAAEDDPEGDYLKARIADMRRAVVREAFPSALVAQRDGADPSIGYEAFDFTPGFVVNANAAEIAAMRRTPGVANVFENALYRPMTDSSITQVGARALWGQGVTGAGVSVAVLDTGVENDHPMIGPAITASACFNTTSEGVSSSLCPNGTDEQTSLTSAEAGDSCVEDNIDSVNGTDGCFHGTHVASTVAGRVLNLTSGRQISGVARAADIVAVNVFSRFEPEECVDEDETPDGACVRSPRSDQIEALDWLYLNRATLNLAAVNMSLGGSEANAEPCQNFAYDRTMSALTQAGIAVVVAAGNDGFANGLSSPACIESAISVGAVDDNDVVAEFSNDADYLDLLAPGVEILAAYGSEQITPGAECQNGADANSEGWCYYFINSDGTSMAAPHVAGAFALLRQAFPSASVADMLTALKVTGEPVMDAFTDRVHARIQIDAAHDFLNTGSGVVRSVSLDSLTRYDTRNTSSDVASFPGTTRGLSNDSGQSRTIRLVSKPEWLSVDFRDNGGNSVSSTALTFDDTGELRLSINGQGLADGFNPGELVLSVDGASTRIRLKVSAHLTTPLDPSIATVRFGPFEWVGDVDQSAGSIFRIVGLDTAMPSAISADIERWGDRDGQSVSNASIACDFTIRPNRYSGNEYIIGAADFADCPRFDRGDLYLDVRVQQADAAQLSMRRFLFNSSGGLTDAAFDPSAGTGVSQSMAARVAAIAGAADEVSPEQLASQADPQLAGDTPQALAQAQFGPFEWTYDANGALRSEFRLGPILQGDELNVDVAIANASEPGYDGAFSDCALTIRSSRRSDNDFQILPEDLADCGAFGRADLTFRVTAESARINATDGDVTGMRMQRFIRQANGALTDYHVDAASDGGVQPSNLGTGQGQVIVGPFEWTGDSTAATSNQFRIAGVSNGAVTSIAVAVANAAAGDYSGGFADCALTLRPQRAGANDYLILKEDLADCGAFGRADLTFRIRAALTDIPGRIKVRRLAFGAQGDITDFGFDAVAGAGQTPSAISGGREEVVFGPFEWVGDAQAGTQAVFRITGIDGGLPETIDVAIANATAGSGLFTGAYTDCSITLRPSRAGDNEYVIGAADFTDCGNFGRGDLSFRIRADAAILQDTVRMRRFAVTRTGGLTDFGFDND